MTDCRKISAVTRTQLSMALLNRAHRKVRRFLNTPCWECIPLDKSSYFRVSYKEMVPQSIPKGSSLPQHADANLGIDDSLGFSNSTPHT